MLNLFRHLIGKRSFTKDLCLSTSCDVGQMLKRHARGFLTLTLASWLHTCLVRLELRLLPTISVTSVCAGFMSGSVIVLCEKNNKQLNKLKNQETKNITKNSRHPELVSGSIHLGMNGKGLLAVAKNVLNKQKNSLRCLSVRCRNEFGMTSDYGVASNSRARRFDAPQSLTAQGLAPKGFV